MFAELKRVEGLGGEGVMIREPRSKYVGSRSHTLLKLKTFHDAEVGNISEWVQANVFL